MSREPGRALSWTVPTGRPAYHEAEEDWTGKHVVLGQVDHGECRLRIRYAFWGSPAEEARWVRAFLACPPSEYGALDFWAYLGEVAKVAEGLA